MSLVSRIRHKVTGRHTQQEFEAAGAKIGKNFMPGGKFEMNLDDCWLIEIGDNFATGPNVTVLAHDASLRNRIGYTKMAPVVIGDNVFLGAGVIVLPGVTIGSNSVVGAGSVVSRDIAENSVAVGAPASVRKSKSQMEAEWSAEVDPSKALAPGWKELAQTEAGRAQLREKLVKGIAWAD